MFSGFDFRYNFVLLFIWIFGVFCSCPQQLNNTVSEDCPFNFFKNGTVCQECPAGFFGNNCSMLCIPPSYGCSCTQQCDCPVCHYIVGCIFTPKSTGTYLEYTAGKNAEQYGTRNFEIISANLIIIFIGVVITLVLLISILYAIRRHCSSEYINSMCNRNDEDLPEIDSVYHEMN